jgi:hypothetical protein
VLIQPAPPRASTVALGNYTRTVLHCPVPPSRAPQNLGRAKEVAQVGAALGREFSHAMLAAVMRKPESKLKSALEFEQAKAEHLRRSLSRFTHRLFRRKAGQRKLCLGCVLVSRGTEWHVMADNGTDARGGLT